MSPIDSLTDADWEVANWILEGLHTARPEVEATGLKPLLPDESEWLASVDLKDGGGFCVRDKLASRAAYRCAVLVAGMIFGGGEE